MTPTAAVEQIVAAGRLVAARGWTPATAGNLSLRIDAGTIAITASGMDKGALAAPDVLSYDLATNQVAGSRPPSAEVLLHAERYRADSRIGAIVHVHSHNATVLSRLAVAEREVVLDGYELLKALDGIRTHDARVLVPILANGQDMTAMAELAAARLSGRGPFFGYLLAGHGLYAWGRTMTDALRHAEALEFLMGCELERMRIER